MVPSIFLSMTGVSIHFIPSLSHLVVKWSMKFSIALLSISIFLSAMPLNECREIESLNLFPFIMYIIFRCKVPAKAAS